MVNLVAFFGNRFNRNALPVCPDVEDVAKNDVFQGVEKCNVPLRKRGIRQGSTFLLYPCANRSRQGDGRLALGQATHRDIKPVSHLSPREKVEDDQTGYR